MRFLVLMTSCVLSVAFSAAADASDNEWTLKPGQHALTFATKDPANMTGGFLLYLPVGFEQGKWPLIVFLHGRGEAGNDVNWLRSRGLPRVLEKQPDFRFIVASPQLLAKVDRFYGSLLDNFLDQLLARLPMIDRERVYVSGLSMGGIGAWQWAASSPGRLAAAAPISNRYDPDRACDMKSVPIWAFHNDKDNLVHLADVQKMVDAVNACGGSAKLTVYPNQTNHDAWTAAYATPELFDWLLSHKRRSSP